MIAVLFPDSSNNFNLFSEFKVLGYSLLYFQVEWLKKQKEIDTIIIVTKTKPLDLDIGEKKIIYIENNDKNYDMQSIKDYLRDEPFYLILGNIIANTPLTILHNEYTAKKSDLIFIYDEKKKKSIEEYFIKTDKAHRLRDFKFNYSEYHLLFKHVFLLSAELLEYIPAEENSAFYEIFLPDMLKRNKFIYGLKNKSFLENINSPEKWYQINYQLLRENWGISASKINNVYYGENCDIDFSVDLQGAQFFGSNCSIKKDCRLSESIFFNDLNIDRNTLVKDTIICDKVKIGEYCEIEKSIIGEGVIIEPHVKIRNAVIAQKSIIKSNSGVLSV